MTILNDLLNTTVEFAKKEPSKVFKAFYVRDDWVRISGSSLHNPTVNRTCKLVKLAYGPIETLEKSRDAGNRIYEFIKEKSFANGVEAFFATNAICGPVWDTLEFLVKSTIVAISSVVMRTIEGFSGLSLALGMCFLTGKSVVKIATSTLSDAQTRKERLTEMVKISQALLDIGKTVSYIALGSFLVLACLFSVPIPGLVFLSLSTSNLFFSIFSFYHKELNLAPQTAPAA